MFHHDLHLPGDIPAKPLILNDPSREVFYNMVVEDEEGRSAYAPCGQSMTSKPVDTDSAAAESTQT
jgi:hypothetical protein